MAPRNQEGPYYDIAEGEGWSLCGHMRDSQHRGTVGGHGPSLGQGRGPPSVSGSAAHMARGLAMPHRPLGLSLPIHKMGQTSRCRGKYTGKYPPRTVERGQVLPRFLRTCYLSARSENAAALREAPATRNTWFSWKISMGGNFSSKTNLIWGLRWRQLVWTDGTVST